MQERVATPFTLHRAGTAHAQAAPELRASHAQHIAQHPQDRRVAIDVDRPVDSIDSSRIRRSSFLWRSHPRLPSIGARSGGHQANARTSRRMSVGRAALNVVKALDSDIRECSRRFGWPRLWGLKSSRLGTVMHKL